MSKRKKKKSKNWLVLSTGTIGGALLMVLFNSLLGPSQPWLVDKLMIKKENVQVSFNVNKITKKRSDFKSTKDTYINPNAPFILEKPKEVNWHIQSFSPGHILDNISVMDLPYFQYRPIQALLSLMLLYSFYPCLN